MANRQNKQSTQPMSMKACSRITLYIPCDENLDPVFDPQSDYDVAVDLCMKNPHATHILSAEYELRRYTSPPEIHKGDK